MVTFEQEKAAFYYEIGDALTCWAAVETTLFGLFSRCIITRDLSALYNAFLAVENFRSKLGMVDKALREKHSQRVVLDRWGDLHDRLITESKIRNRIAHRPSQQYPDARAGRRFGLIDRADTLLPLYRRDFSTEDMGQIFSKRDVAPPGTLFVRDISQINKRWFILGADIVNLDLYLGGAKDQLPKLYAPAGKSPDLQSLVDRIRKELAPPQS